MCEFCVFVCRCFVKVFFFYIKRPEWTFNMLMDGICINAYIYIYIWICSFYHSGTVLISLSSSLLAPCSNIGKTDPNSPLAVSQSCQRPQGIPQQGTPGLDGPVSNKKTVVSFWPRRIILSLLWLAGVVTCHRFSFYTPPHAFSPVHRASLLPSSHRLSLPSSVFCQSSALLPSPPLQLLLWHFVSSFPPPFPTVSHPSFTFTPPQDPKERLGCHPQTGFADIMGHPFFRNVDWDLVSHSLLFFWPFSICLSHPTSRLHPDFHHKLKWRRKSLLAGQNESIYWLCAEGKA